MHIQYMHLRWTEVHQGQRLWYRMSRRRFDLAAVLLETTDKSYTSLTSSWHAIFANIINKLLQRALKVETSQGLGPSVEALMNGGKDFP